MRRPATRLALDLAPSAIAAAAGALILLAVSALLGSPNVAMAIAFFAVFLTAYAVLVVARPSVTHDLAWTVRSSGQFFALPPRPGGASPAGMGLFDRFNDRAKRVLALAQDEAIRFNHNYIGTEHLLLGLVREGEGVAALVLVSLGVELANARAMVEMIIGRGDAATTPSEITLSPRTKKVIEFAIDEARKLGHSHVGTEHVLLGLVREGQGIASGMLESLGLSGAQIAQRVREELA